MKPAPKRTQLSKRKSRSNVLLTLTLCFLPLTFHLLPSSPPAAVAQTIDARKAEADRLSKQG